MMEKNRIPVDRIIFKDDTEREYEIEVPSLVALFWSDKLQKSFDKEPDRKYSVSELLELMDMKCSKSTLRNYINRMDLFINEENGKQMYEIRADSDGIVRMQVSQLNPIVKFVFDAVNSIKQELKDAKN